MRSALLGSRVLALGFSPFGVLGSMFEMLPVLLSAPVATPAKADFVFVGDRSGSMWHEISNVRSAMTKVLGVHEVLGGGIDLTLSMISYSSDGDCTTHFSHVDMTKAATDAHVAKQIQSLESTGCTGMSQGIKAAMALARPGRVLYVLVHSDGYCNDPGVRSEQENSAKYAAEIVAKGGVLSTVCYGSYADFAFLSALAQKGGGVCLRAGNAKDMYVAMETGAKAAANLQAQAIVVRADGAEIVALVDPQSRTVQAVVGGKDLVLPSLPGKDAQVVKFTRMNPANTAKMAPESPMACLVAARALLSVGMVAEAKDLVIGSRVAEARKHWRALTSAEQRDLSAALDDLIFGDVDFVLDAEVPVLPAGPSILDFFAVVGEYPGAFEVDIQSLRGGYSRRTVGRIAGSRSADGTIVPFPFALKAADQQWAKVTDVVINRTSPTVSLQTLLPGTLVAVPSDAPVDTIGPVDIRGKLTVTKNYTIIGDGSVYFPSAKFKVSDRRAREALSAMGIAVSGDTWEATVEFSKMAVVKNDPGNCLATAAKMRTVLKAMSLSKLLSAAKPKGESATFEASIVTALKEHGLTPNLNFSAPTINPYTDLKQALSDGIIDTRVGYSVTIGLPEAPGFSDELMSGNKFIERRFTASKGGTEVGKDDLDATCLLDGATWSAKALSSRSKPAFADEIMFPVFCGALGVAEQGAEAALTEALTFAYGSPEKAKAAADKIAQVRTGKLDRATAIGEVDSVRRAIDRAVDAFWYDHISPVVLYAGGVGSLPASIGAKKVDVKAVPGKVSKEATSEGAFYQSPGGLLITILAEQEYFPTGKKAA